MFKTEFSYNLESFQKDCIKYINMCQILIRNIYIYPDFKKFVFFDILKLYCHIYHKMVRIDLTTSLYEKKYNK